MRGSLSPLDGRYSDKIEPIRSIFNERALVGKRIDIELEYFHKLYEVLNLGHSPVLNSIPSVDRVFEIEKVTKHDVKAVELAIAEQLDREKDKALVHACLTSQDVNSLALTLQIRECVQSQINPLVFETVSLLKDDFYERYKPILMVARTHGQPATPTSLGKEFMVFSERLRVVNESLENHEFTTKFGGATGGFNAHQIAYPDVDWEKFGNEFIESFGGVQRQKFTTQIENYDGLGAVFDACKRINIVLIDLCQDVWQYISLGYLKEKVDLTSTGSSTMPHKINPILFENAEGNLVIANALFELFSRKLPVSRMQRDLTDSTVTRNIGTAFGHMVLAIKNIQAGLRKIEPDLWKITVDLDSHPEVITEGLQCILRSDGDSEAYNKFKTFLRTSKTGITLSQIRDFIRKEFSESPRLHDLLSLTPQNYFPTK